MIDITVITIIIIVIQYNKTILYLAVQQDFYSLLGVPLERSC